MRHLPGSCLLHEIYAGLSVLPNVFVAMTMAIFAQWMRVAMLMNNSVGVGAAVMSMCDDMGMRVLVPFLQCVNHDERGS